MEEIWKPIPGWRYYEASDQGRVRSVDHLVGSGLPGKGNNRRVVKGRVLRPGPQKTGHLTVALSDSEAGVRGFSVTVHKLVMLAFGPPKPSNRHEIRHQNGVESDNRYVNIVWSTRGRNTQDKKWHKGQRNRPVTPRMVQEILRCFETPWYGMGRELARKYGVSESIISKVKLRQLHADVSTW